MRNNPIIEDVRNARGEIEEECGNDSDALYRFALEVQEEHAGRVVSRGPAPARTKKVSS